MLFSSKLIFRYSLCVTVSSVLKVLMAWAVSFVKRLSTAKILSYYTYFQYNEIVKNGEKYSKYFRNLTKSIVFIGSFVRNHWSELDKFAIIRFFLSSKLLIQTFLIFFVGYVMFLLETRCNGNQLMFYFLIGLYFPGYPRKFLANNI